MPNENRGALARQYFLEGYNCAQSVLLAFAQESGLGQRTAALIGSSLGGGMGRLREVCGALSAILVLDGLFEGYDSPTDPQAKAEHYARVQELAGRFRERTGSILCRELLALPQGPDSPVPEARSAAYYAARPCAGLVACAAELLQERLEARK